MVGSLGLSIPERSGISAGVIGADGYIAPDTDTGTLSDLTDTLTITGDGGGRPLSKRYKVQVVVRNITFTGTITSVDVELREQSGQTWRTTSGDYKYTRFDQAATTGWTNSASMPVATNTTPTDLMFELFGLGLAVPTQLWSRDMTVAASGADVIGAFSTGAEVEDAFRIVFRGTSVDLSGGTYEIVFF